MAQNRVQPRAGTKRYKLKEELGRGSFGVVQRCVQCITGLEYAAKIIDTARLSQSELKDVEREAEICRSLRHPNIVQLHDSFFAGRHFVLIMDLVTGGELFEDICRRSHYSEASASDCMHQVLFAVAYFHQHGVIHRDLKPENLLLTSRKPGADVKVADFGLAVQVRNDNPKWLGMAGTYLYMAPEMIEGLPYTKAVDIWSCGVILYLLLAGYAPFYGSTESSLFKRIVNGDYKYPAQPWNKISLDAKELIDSMLTTDPARRITAKQALQHPWFQQITPTKINLTETVRKLKLFNARRKFKGAVWTTMAINEFQKVKQNTPDSDSTDTMLSEVTIDDVKGNGLNLKIKPNKKANLYQANVKPTRQKLTNVRAPLVSPRSQSIQSKADVPQHDDMKLREIVNLARRARQRSEHRADNFRDTEPLYISVGQHTPRLLLNPRLPMQVQTQGQNLPWTRRPGYLQDEMYYRNVPGPYPVENYHVTNRPVRRRSNLYYLHDFN